MERYRFFDSIDPNNPDRTYNAEEFTAYFKALVTTGVMKGAGNMLKVSANGANMITTVDTGTAFVQGHQYENDSPLALTHEIEAVGRNRIDRVVLRLDLSMASRYVRAFIKRGVAGTSPAPPPLTREGNIYEISLAQVKVVGGQTYINVNDLTDERGEPDISPWASSKILPNESLQPVYEELDRHKNTLSPHTSICAIATMSAVQSLPASTISIINLNTVAFDNGGLWSSADKGFKCKQAGRYVAVARGTTSTPTAPCTKSIRIRHGKAAGGIDYLQSETYDPATGEITYSQNVVGVLDLKVNDTVSLIMTHTSNNALNTAFANSCSLAIYKI